MTDIESQVKSLEGNSPFQLVYWDVLKDNTSCKTSGCSESLLYFGHRADVALAPSCGGHMSRSCHEVKRLEGMLLSIQLQLQFLLSKAYNLQNGLNSGQNHLERQVLVTALSNLLYNCRAFFSCLESSASVLFDRLEQLVLLYASFDFFSLNETEPNSMSHFCIGQSQLGQMKLTIFRYCKPTPYLARVNSGLYKRMRWNVERILYEKHQDGDCDDRQEKTDSHTDYYFLCYEDISNTHKEADRVSQDVSRDSLTRMWSIGQWVQVNPDPKTEDISDWITCEVPQANYHRLLFLGHEEPSSCIATNCLQQLLHHVGPV